MWRVCITDRAVSSVYGKRCDVDLRRFQKQFLDRALADDVDTAVLSIPRGNGKSFLAAHILTRCLTPSDALFVSGAEYLQCAGSIEQARIVFRFVRQALEATGEYRFLDSATRIGITHKETNTRLRVLSSNGKTGMGIVGCPILVCDEAGSWEVNGGELMWDAITTAQGKPGSKMRVILIGTVAPAMAGWWPDLVKDGSNGSTYVMALQGDINRWDQWPEIRRVNPLTAIDAGFRKKLLEERDKAREDTRLRARFCSYRMNTPMGDESEVLLTVADWERLERREVPDRAGRPIVGVDLGGGRAWSAATAIWPNGRTEAKAVAPGIPSLEEQEKRDRVPAGTYGKLYDAGQLEIAHGLRVPPVSLLWEMIRGAWGRPSRIVCDRFRLADLEDAVGHGCKIEPRVTRWSEAAADIRALRRMALDGPMTVEHDSRMLIATSLSQAMVKNDDQGNVRLVKRSTNNCARDDVAAALTLAAGLWERKPTPPRLASAGLAG